MVLNNLILTSVLSMQYYRETENEVIVSIYNPPADLSDYLYNIMSHVDFDLPGEIKVEVNLSDGCSLHWNESFHELDKILDEIVLCLNSYSLVDFHANIRFY